MQQQNIPIGTLVDMYKRGEWRLPEIQRHSVWRATRVRDLLDSLYRGYPSGSILMQGADPPAPARARRSPRRDGGLRTTADLYADAHIRPGVSRALIRRYRCR